jgi:hypothetical protein
MTPYLSHNTSDNLRQLSRAAGICGVVWDGVSDEYLDQQIVSDEYLDQQIYLKSNNKILKKSAKKIKKSRRNFMIKKLKKKINRL